MAARGNNTHYCRWAKILPRHWFSTAERCDFDSAEEILAELAEATPAVIERVRQKLPNGFPVEVSEPILAGLERAAERLSAG